MQQGKGGQKVNHFFSIFTPGSWGATVGWGLRLACRCLCLDVLCPLYHVFASFTETPTCSMSKEEEGASGNGGRLGKEAPPLLCCCVCGPGEEEGEAGQSLTGWEEGLCLC